MDRNIKYKTICRVGIYGDDDINTLSNSQYNIYPSSITGITVVNGGSNYSQSATQINVIGSGSGATVSFNVTSGVITTIIGFSEPMQNLHSCFLIDIILNFIIIIIIII
jgi:hypothetical protein